MRYRVSNRLRLAVLQRRCDGQRQYEIAKQAGLHPVVASSLLNDIRPVRADDERVIALGRVVGLTPDECFETSRGAE